MTSTNTPKRWTRPKPPRPLGADGLRLWRSILTPDPSDPTVPRWVLRPDELQALSMACEQVQRAADLLAGVDLAHPLVPGSAGNMVLHPAIAEARQLEAEARRALVGLKLPDTDADSMGADAYRQHQANAANARWGKGSGAAAAGE